MSVALSHGVNRIIAQLLIDLGLGSAVPADENAELEEWPVYIGLEPTSPDNCLTVYTTVGIGDIRVMYGTLHQHYGFQIRLRSATQEVGELKGYEVRRQLAENVTNRQVTVADSDFSLVVASYHLPCIARIGQLLDNGRDGVTARRIYTLNATAVILPL